MSLLPSFPALFRFCCFLAWYLWRLPCEWSAEVPLFLVPMLLLQILHFAFCISGICVKIIPNTFNLNYILRICVWWGVWIRNCRDTFTFYITRHYIILFYQNSLTIKSEGFLLGWNKDESWIMNYNYIDYEWGFLVLNEEWEFLIELREFENSFVNRW